MILAKVIKNQQHYPVKIGLTPDFINIIISVLRAIAAIAKIIKNFDKYLDDLKKYGSKCMYGNQDLELVVYGQGIPMLNDKIKAI